MLVFKVLLGKLMNTGRSSYFIYYKNELARSNLLLVLFL